MFFNTVVLRGQCGLYKMQDAKPENLDKKKLGFFQYKLSWIKLQPYSNFSRKVYLKKRSLVLNFGDYYSFIYYWFYCLFSCLIVCFSSFGTCLCSYGINTAFHFRNVIET